MKSERQREREQQAAANRINCAASSLSPLPSLVDVLAAFILAAIEHFNHLVLALSGSKLCFLIIVVSSSFINCCISVQYTHHTHTHIHIYSHNYIHTYTQSHTHICALYVCVCIVYIGNILCVYFKTHLQQQQQIKYKVFFNKL